MYKSLLTSMCWLFIKILFSFQRAVMADRPNRPQPFRFWLPFWANSTLTPPRPPISAPRQLPPPTPASTPLPPTQPQSPSQTQPKSPPASATRAARHQPPSSLPSLARKSSPSLPGNRKEQQHPSPSRLQVPSPMGLMGARKESHPSQPSRLDSKEQPAIQNASRSPSKGASQPQPAAIQESSEVPSQPLPPSSQPKSPIGSISHPNQSDLLPQESRPVVQTKSPTQLQPEPQMQTQEMNPIQPSYMPQDNQATQDLEAKQNSVSSLEKNFPAEIEATPNPYPSISEKEPKETKEEKPRNFPESKLDMQPSNLLKSEEDPEIGTKEQPKTKAEANQENSPAENLEAGRHVEGMNEDESKTKPETQPQEPQAEASNGPEKTMEAKLSNVASDTKPTRSSPKASDIIAKLRSSKPEHSKKKENVAGNEPTKNGASKKEGKIAISTMSCASFSDAERAPFVKEIKEGLSRLVQNLSIGHSKRIPNGQAVSMITLAGENNGASMVIGSDIHVHGGFKHDTSSDNVDGRWNPRRNGNSAITASINSNVQSINNSTLHDSSCNARDPGIHLNLSSKKMEATKLGGQTEPLKPQKPALSITPDQKPSHEPRIRRRCLRALFMEPSESDPENPQKPRRHGCRFNCGEKKKGKGELDGTSTTNSNARQVGEGPSSA